MKNVFAYIRVSTAKQNPQRQYGNISRYAEDNGLYITKYFEDKFTGKEFNRPEFDKMKSRVDRAISKGDEVIIIFDSVSRMSRTAAEGVEQYFAWYDQGVELVFLHEMAINTESYKKSMREVGMTGTDADLILDGVNKFLRRLAENQIIAGFEQAEKEGRDIKSRVIEGLNASEKQGGRPAPAPGEKLETEKSKRAKAYILKNSARYGGNLNDTQCMKIAGISRPTFYTYLKQIEADRAAEQAKRTLESRA